LSNQGRLPSHTFNQIANLKHKATRIGQRNTIIGSVAVFK